MIPKSKTALFAGSFRPFTIGHESIVERTLKICDYVIIGFGINPDKQDHNLDRYFESTCALYKNDSRVKVEKYSGLTTDFAKSVGADFLVRGVRNVSDFEYELNLADINLRISGLETIFIPSLPELSYISSSMVRELESYGKDVSEFLP